MMISFLLVLVATFPNCPPATDWIRGSYKDPAARADDRDAHRDRFYLAMHDLGLDREAREVGLVIAWNESRFDACAIHKQGRNEWGRGMGGHLVDPHLEDKWGSAPEFFMHFPEVTAVMIARTMRRHRRGSWVTVHRGHAGWRPQWAIDRFCRRLKARGVDCRGRVSDVGRKLGRKPGHPAQHRWLMRMLGRAAT